MYVNPKQLLFALSFLLCASVVPFAIAESKSLPKISEDCEKQHEGWRFSGGYGSFAIVHFETVSCLWSEGAATQAEADAKVLKYCGKYKCEIVERQDDKRRAARALAECQTVSNWNALFDGGRALAPFKKKFGGGRALGPSKAKELLAECDWIETNAPFGQDYIFPDWVIWQKAILLYNLKMYSEASDEMDKYFKIYAGSYADNGPTFFQKVFAANTYRLAKRFGDAQSIYENLLSRTPQELDREWKGLAQNALDQINRDYKNVKREIAWAKQADPVTKPVISDNNVPISVVGSDRKVALVIGNSAYRNAVALPNPRNDANAMSAMLKGMGFEVISVVDADKPAMEVAIRDFIQKSKSADVSLLHYSGHAMEIGGENFLIPVDAVVKDETALSFELINTKVITNAMGGEKQVGIVLLDACRDNPFAQSLKRSLVASRSASVSAGLAQISSEGGGLVVGFATAPGDVASDGSGNNSPFTAALLKWFPQKGLEIEQVMKRVKADVSTSTNNEQRPWTNSDLTADVYLAGK